MRYYKIIFILCSFSIVYIIGINFSRYMARESTIIDRISTEDNTSDVLEDKSFKINEWIINGNVLQYSAISTFNSNQDIELESIVLFNNQPSPSHTRCIVVIDQSYVINKTIDDLFKMETTHYSIYKASCTISKNLVNATSEVLVAIVDSRDHLALESIFFHTPVQRPRPVKKKQSLINCIQTLRNVNALSARQLENYIQINRAMGVDKLRFCTIDYENELILNLTRTYSDYIDFVPIDLNVERVCARLGLDVSSCQKKWGSFLNYRKLLGLYEKLCSNECFMRYRYEYQYVSNYDVDEFIFPRYFATNYLNRIDTSSLSVGSNKSQCGKPYQQYLEEVKSANFRYNITTYIHMLEKKYGSKVSCFSFENYLVINRYDYFFDKIKESSQSQAATILYENQKDGLKFQLTVGDNKPYLNKLVGLIDLAKCLNETYLNTSKLTNIWKNGAVNLINNRLGKSISNTDNTLSLNQHSCSVTKKGTRKISVSTDIGYVSHFRTSDIGSGTILKYNIEHFKIDIEYLFFLVSIYSPHSRLF